MNILTFLGLWLLVSILLGLVVSRCIAFGMGDDHEEG